MVQPRNIIAAFAVIGAVLGPAVYVGSQTTPTATPSAYSYPMRPPAGKHPSSITLADGRVVYPNPDGSFSVHQWEMPALLKKGWTHASMPGPRQ
jgi:hypothetical protein